MRPETLSLLRCPACHGNLDVARRHALGRTGRLCAGILACRACDRRYPVIDWIPRLLPHESLTPAERAELAASPERDEPQTVSEEQLAPDELRRLLETRVRSKLLHPGMPPKLRARAERDVAYRVEHTGEKGKFVRTAEPYLTQRPERILDLGGGQGGTLTAFRQRYRPTTAMLLDLDPDWVEIARWRDPETEVIRADATRAPLADGAIDLLVSTATLEHLPDWRGALAEIVRISREGLLSYGPNGRFPYDFGHLDAPFVTWLRPHAAAHVAHLCHRLRRTGRTLTSIEQELAVTFYIPRSAVVRELRRRGVEVVNVFEEFLGHAVAESYHPRAGGLKRTLARFPWLRTLFAKGLLIAGAEPNVYLYYRRPRVPR
ncbi:MAG: methyltransferase domain-containing protein [Candidatus Eisenbacteria sp.]|nr:methyltransferase domain-containing protein [Candidatus Eisenbacteria bacterium]